MLEINPVRIAYAVMVIGIVFTFLFSRRAKGDLRSTAGEFVFPFLRLSNYISPKAPKNHLRVERKNGRVIPLPVDQQSGEIRAILARANEEEPVRLFAEMVAAEDKLAKQVGINRTDKAQFSDPIHDTLLMAHIFLQGCENLSTIDTERKLAQFESFLYDQVKHRLMLMRRISGKRAEEFHSLNTAYADEMEAMEIAEAEAARKKK